MSATLAAALLLATVTAGDGAAPDAALPERPLTLELPAKTAIDIEIADSISSKSAKIGDMFDIRLVEPVKVDGHLILPIGVTGRGEVSHVAKAGWGGKAGELIVMVRYLQCGADRIPIGRFHFGASGESHFGAAVGASMIVPLAGFLIDGDEMILQAGTRGNAKVAAAINLPVGDRPCSIPSQP